MFEVEKVWTMKGSRQVKIGYSLKKHKNLGNDGISQSIAVLNCELIFCNCSPDAAKKICPRENGLNKKKTSQKINNHLSQLLLLKHEKLWTTLL